MKAYLNYKNIDTEDRKLRTHNLLMLLKVCVSQNQKFEKMKKYCGILNPNDTLYRYFNSYQVMPEEDEIIELIELAEDLYNFVLELVE